MMAIGRRTRRSRSNKRLQGSPAAESNRSFQRPLAPDTLEYRAVQEDARPDEIVQSDAQEILKAVFNVLQRSAV